LQLAYLNEASMIYLALANFLQPNVDHGVLLLI